MNDHLPMTKILPLQFIERIKTDFGNEADPFFQSLKGDSPVSFRVNPLKGYQPVGLEAVAWCETGYYLPTRPVFTLDPLLHSGAYYVQEASSMFLEQALKQTVDLSQPLKLLDLCASPGGKSTHLISLISDESLLVSNEVIRPRAKVLGENLTKWGKPNVIVTNNDPSDFQRLPGFFDVLVVDAPCSGEGLFRKDPNAMNEWSEENVNLCAARQKRIIADVWEALKPGGIIIYSTCTYNQQEDEENLQWMIEEMEAEPLTLDVAAFPEITPSEVLPGYHFYPHKTKGEGFFIAVLRKKNGMEFRNGKLKKPALSKVSQTIQKEISPWIVNPELFDFWSFQEKVLVFSVRLSNILLLLIDKLSIVQAGTEVCEVKGKDLIPSHSFALSTILNKAFFNTEEVDLETALHYLKKEDIKPAGTSQYLLAIYKGTPLGWLKKAGNRYNNLFPKEWRIRMSI
jgi:16S rRNA C967 or C1407 C5-methylase (RsmB/RsmF family)/NOL1/NOP2/fmu family ribosome biogenesis protein